MLREGRKREKNKEEKRERERGGNACEISEICFQKVIRPNFSASNPNVVSGVKSCQSSNGRQAAM